MFKVDILEDAKRTEAEADQFVEQTKHLLLAEGTKERALLSAAGLDTADVAAVRLREDAAMRKELKMKTGAVAVLKEEEIKALCLKYRLRFLPSKYYSGTIDNLTGRKLAKFMEDMKEPSPEHAAAHKLYVMAPVEAFKLDLVRAVPDPILFYRMDRGFESPLYCVIHKWGNDFTVMRAIKALPKRSEGTDFRLAITVLSVLALVCAWNITSPLEHFGRFMLGLIPCVIGGFMLLAAYAKATDGTEYSDDCWNKHTTTRR